MGWMDGRTSIHKLIVPIKVNIILPLVSSKISVPRNLVINFINNSKASLTQTEWFDSEWNATLNRVIKHCNKSEDANIEAVRC